MVSKSKILKCHHCGKKLEELYNDGYYECPDTHCSVTINDDGEVESYEIFVMKNGEVQYKIDQFKNSLWISEKTDYRKRKYVLVQKGIFIPLRFKDERIVGVDNLVDRLLKMAAFI